MSWAEVLKDRYEDALDIHRSAYIDRNDPPEYSKLVFIADVVFDFTTYDNSLAEWMATIALSVCAAITNRQTFEFIADEDRYKAYVMMMNMPFFQSRTGWGTSIRGAWWDYDLITIDGQHLNVEQWKEYILALIDFAMDES